MTLEQAYQLLEIGRDAPAEAIRQRYHDLAAIWHPDRHEGNQRRQNIAVEKMKNLNAAYNLICNNSKESTSNTKVAGQNPFNVIMCTHCGAFNRLSSYERNVKCGRCKNYLFKRPSNNQDDASGRKTCGDDDCTGTIGINGKCNYCGKSHEEGIRATLDKERLNQTAEGAKGQREKRNKVRKCLGLVTTGVLALICIMIFKPASEIKVSNGPAIKKDPYKSPRQPTIEEWNAATPVVAVEAYVRPSTAPNGQFWPNTADYVRGYDRLNTNGVSSVTIDNSKNGSDVFVKLVSVSGSSLYPVRVCFIPAYGSFSLKNVTAGKYDIRYRDLNSGSLSRSEAFFLEETSTYTGTQYSDITITLYKVRHGNMHTYGLSEAEF